METFVNVYLITRLSHSLIVVTIYQKYIIFTINNVNNLIGKIFNFYLHLLFYLKKRKNNLFLLRILNSTV